MPDSPLTPNAFPPPVSKTRSPSSHTTPTQAHPLLTQARTFPTSGVELLPGGATLDNGRALATRHRPMDRLRGGTVISTVPLSARLNPRRFSSGAKTLSSFRKTPILPTGKSTISVWQGREPSKVLSLGGGLVARQGAIDRSSNNKIIILLSGGWRPVSP